MASRSAESRGATTLGPTLNPHNLFDATDCGRRRKLMIHRSASENSFEFVRVASLRAAQLMRGCVAHLEASKKAVVTAQREVALGLVRALPRVPPTVPPVVVEPVAEPVTL